MPPRNASARQNVGRHRAGSPQLRVHPVRGRKYPGRARRERDAKKNVAQNGVARGKARRGVSAMRARGVSSRGAETLSFVERGVRISNQVSPDVVTDVYYPEGAWRLAKTPPWRMIAPAQPLREPWPHSPRHAEARSWGPGQRMARASLLWSTPSGAPFAMLRRIIICRAKSTGEWPFGERRRTRTYLRFGNPQISSQKEWPRASSAKRGTLSTKCRDARCAKDPPQIIRGRDEFNGGSAV